MGAFIKGGVFLVMQGMKIQEERLTMNSFLEKKELGNPFEILDKEMNQPRLVHLISKFVEWWCNVLDWYGLGKSVIVIAW